MNKLPLLDAIQFQRAFSLGANVTLLAANNRNDRLNMTGSGIYTPDTATYHHAQKGDPEEGRLLVARVPVLDPQWVGQSEAIEEGGVMGETMSLAASDSEYYQHDNCPSAPPSPNSFTSSMMHDPFKFVLLNDTEGDLKVCDGSFCCCLQYQRSPLGSIKELYALGAFAGIHIHGHYALQVGKRNVSDT